MTMYEQKPHRKMDHRPGLDKSVELSFAKNCTPCLAVIIFGEMSHSRVFLISLSHTIYVQVIKFDLNRIFTTTA